MWNELSSKYGTLEFGNVFKFNMSWVDFIAFQGEAFTNGLIEINLAN